MRGSQSLVIHPGKLEYPRNLGTVSTLSQSIIPVRLPRSSIMVFCESKSGRERTKVSSWLADILPFAEEEGRHDEIILSRIISGPMASGDRLLGSLW